MVGQPSAIGSVHRQVGTRLTEQNGASSLRSPQLQLPIPASRATPSEPRASSITSVAPRGVNPSFTSTLAKLLTKEDRTCPSCGGKMRLWLGRHGPFLQCANTTCGYRRTVDERVVAQVLKDLDARCERCGSSLSLVPGSNGPVIRCSRRHTCQYKVSWKEIKERYS
jgi:hypothetical protein